jgi:hypothetical protein
MIPATEKQTLAEGESSSPLASRLDLLLTHAITTEQFEADMVRACRQDPEEIWTLLALLDQHHRLETLPTELFRALKAAADRYGLVRREPYLPNQSAKSRAPATTPAAKPPRASAPVTPPPAPTPPDATAPDTAPPAPTPARASAPMTPPPAPTTRAVTPTIPLPPAPELAVPPDAAPAPAVVAPPVVVEHVPTRIVEVGSVIGGRYRLETELESDDRGRNFQALDQQHAGQPAAVCQVAVHCMEPSAANFEADLAERRTEFQLAQPLAHPNVLSVRDLDQDGVYIYLTMNLMRGETLAALLARRQGEALARSAAFAIIRDIGAALTYTHDHGVMHGNLQPQSILISPAGELRVRGFGAQRASSCYASCEQLENRPPDRRDDLYSLACISYELLHGSHPFNRHNASTARGRGLTPARPIQLSGPQWRALRMGLAWRREGRNVSIERWIERMHLRGASKRLPMLVDLMAMPPPRRSWGRLIFVVGCLAAAAIFALGLYHSPGMADLAGNWNTLRAALIGRAHPAAPASAPAMPAPPPVATIPAPTAAPAVQVAATPAPNAEPIAVPPAAAPESAPPTAPLAAPKAAPAKPPAAIPSAPSRPATKATAATTPTAVAAATVARIELSADHYAVQPSDSAARILVRRSGGARGEVRFVWWTENASASADLDFVAWGRRVERIPAGQGSVTLLVPIIKDTTRNAARTFYVIIGEAGDGAKVGGITRAAVLLPGNG